MKTQINKKTKKIFGSQFLFDFKEKSEVSYFSVPRIGTKKKYDKKGYKTICEPIYWLKCLLAKILILFYKKKTKGNEKKLAF